MSAQSHLFLLALATSKGAAYFFQTHDRVFGYRTEADSENAPGIRAVWSHTFDSASDADAFREIVRGAGLECDFA